MAAAAAVLKLQRSGFSQEQVEALAEFSEAQVDVSKLATKADLDAARAATRTDLELLEQRVTIKLGAMMVVAVGAVAALVRLL